MTEEDQLKTNCFHLAESLIRENRIADMRILRALIARQYQDSDDLYSHIAGTLAKSGHIEYALDEVIRWKSSTNLNIANSPVFKEIMELAVESHSRMIASHDLLEALKVTNKLAEIFPHSRPVLESGQTLSNALNDKEKLSYYSAELARIDVAELEQLNQRALDAHARNRYDEELSWRLSIAQCAGDRKRHPAFRHENIYNAISCLFLTQLDGKAQEIVGALVRDSAPPLTGLAEPLKEDKLGRFDQFYRLSIALANVADIYNPLSDELNKPRLTYYSCCSRKELAENDISRICAELKITTCFFTAATELFYRRCARSYTMSILQNCDVGALVFICITGHWATFEEAANILAITDERVILCTENVFHTLPRTKQYDASPLPDESKYPLQSEQYYAAVGLLHVWIFIELFHIPVFLTGIDTILQRGVRDLLEQCADADVVLNQVTGGFYYSSLYINSLQLILPTDNSKIFSRYYRRSFLKLLEMPQQPFAADQLYLTFAKHHLCANGQNVVLKTFNEYDINNLMFNVDNIYGREALLAKYRFVNIFASGQGSNSLPPEHIVSNIRK